MKSILSIFSAILILSFSILACNLPSSNGISAASTAAAQTIEAQGAQQPTQVDPTATFTTFASPTLPPPAQPIPTQPILATATPTGTYFVVDTGANCRFGPGTAYAIVTSFAAGAYVTLVGHNSDNSWWYVLTGSTNCWISATLGHTTGSLAALPLISAPPTPTTVAGTGPTLSDPIALVAEVSYPSNCTSNTLQTAIHVSDNGNGINSVWMKYRYLGDGGYTGNWHTVSPNDSAAGGLNGFNYAIGTEAATELGTENGTLQYQFFAKDNSGNTSSYPNGSVLGMPIKYCP